MIYLYILLGGLVLVALLAAARAFVNADPRSIARFLRLSAIGLGAVVFLGLMTFLAVTGRLFVLFVPIGALFALFRWGVLRRGLWRRAGSAAGRSSDVETDTVRMHLDHDTGEISGVVRRGPQAGRKLDELTRSDLFALWRQCRVDDAQAAQLLEAYLDRLDPNWRTAEAGSTAGAARGPASDAMSRAEALAMLGLADGADAAAVKDAHRRLMMKLHPDHGGTAYLAARLNRAREILLGG